MAIPFLSLADQTQALKAEALRALEAVIDSQGFANGPAVKAFEDQFAEYLGVRHVVAVNNGTTALHASLICAGVKPGDEVITVSHTWISTAWAISYCGARPVFADIDPGTACLDPSDIERRITPQTRAIVVVHLYGHPANLDPILEIARRRNLPVIEDAAQSIGAQYKGKQTGTLGLVNATSFYPGKNLGAWGEGGAVITNDDAIAARVRLLRDHAQAGRHHHVELGFNWRMDGFQGAVLSIKLRHLDAWNARRREIAKNYRRGLSDLVNVRLLPESAWAEPIWHIFPIFCEKREELRRLLDARGVSTGVHYPTPVHLQPVYEGLGIRRGELPQAERMAAEEISLPMFPELTDEQANHVIAAVRTASAELG